ncbi:MAG: carboxypeptidase-like regulatory domain-containing protein [Bacteroidota bacterium]
MMKKLLAVLVILLGTYGLCHAQYTVSGQVNDESTGQPISGVNLSIKGSSLGTTSDVNGLFQFRINSFPVDIQLTHVAYKGKSIRWDSIPQDFQLLFMQAKVTRLDEVVVSAGEATKSLSDHRQQAITAFELAHNRLYWIEYYNSFTKKRLFIGDLDGNKLDSIPLKGIRGIEGFYKSCNQTVYLHTRTKAYELGAPDNKLKIVNHIPRDTFEHFVQPCKLLQNGNIYYLFSRYKGLVRKLSRYDLTTAKAEAIRVVADEAHLRRLWEDAGFMRRSAATHNMLVDTWQENARIKGIMQDGDFLTHFFYKAKYPVDLYGLSHEMALVNHPEKKIEIYKDNQLVRSVDISYPDDKKWLKTSLFDEKRQRLYCTFKSSKGLLLKEIDIDTGELASDGLLLDADLQEHEGIRIHDQVVYYLKDSGKNNRKELIRQSFD